MYWKLQYPVLLGSIILFRSFTHKLIFFEQQVQRAKKWRGSSIRSQDQLYHSETIVRVIVSRHYATNVIEKKKSMLLTSIIRSGSLSFKSRISKSVRSDNNLFTFKILVLIQAKLISNSVQ